jgi:hypothetical protein
MLRLRSISFLTATDAKASAPELYVEGPFKQTKQREHTGIPIL